MWPGLSSRGNRSNLVAGNATAACRGKEAGTTEAPQVVTRGDGGHLALYRYDEAPDRVPVLAIRRQREEDHV